MMETRVAQYIKEHKLLEPKDQIIVGLSGGADSVALILLLKELGYTCIGAHCNFHLRGEEANRDEQFVTHFCQEHSFPLHKTHFDTYHYAKTHKVSIEMACRELRYEWFHSLIEGGIANKLAIAHHRDDNIETLLLNLIRGTGIKGLTGIQPINQYIVRPLLETSRQDIEAYLKARNQSFVTDSTNLEEEYARNKVRLTILPAMEQINTACQANISRTIGYLNQTYLIYQKAVQEAIERVVQNQTIQGELLLKETAAETILYEICYPLGFNSSQVKDIYNSLLSTSESRVFYSSTHQLNKERENLHILPLEGKSKMSTAPKLSYKLIELNDSFKIPRDKNTACFDAELIDKTKLGLRKWAQGDRFIPFGMKGSKSLSDFFVDQKYSLQEKEMQWLLTHDKDIIWIIGQRSDNRYRLTSSSKKALIVKIEQ